MNKLLSASFIRLKKDKIFWIGLIFMFGAGVFFPVMRYMDMTQTGYKNNIDNGFFAASLFIGIVTAVFCSLYIGTEYSDGTIRNKVVVGQTRPSIYLSNLIVCAIVSVVMCAVFFAVYLCVDIPLLGFFEMELPFVFLYALAVFLLAVAFSSTFCFISMLNQNKAITAVICILLSFFMIFIGMQLNRILNEPETNMDLIMTENGQEYEEIPNPKYLDEGERKVVQFLYDVLPGGQAVQCMSLEANHIAVLPVYSLIIVALTTGIGLFFFRKKELK